MRPVTPNLPPSPRRPPIQDPIERSAFRPMRLVSFRGRIDRRTFWGITLILWLAYVVTVIPVSRLEEHGWTGAALGSAYAVWIAGFAFLAVASWATVVKWTPG